LNGFMPHGHCYLWSPGLIALHSISDSFIALAYMSIPITLAILVRRRGDLSYSWMFMCFAVFILACGTTHLMEIWNIWHSSYWLSGGIKAVTATASVLTAILLIKLMPQLLLIRTPQQLEALNRELHEQATQNVEKSLQLEATNRQLKVEIDRSENLNVLLAEQAEELRRQRQEAVKVADEAVVAQVRLQHLTNELKRSNEDLVQFASVASHDLQEPLRAVSGCLELLSSRYSGHLDEKAAELIDHSVQGAKRMRALILDLLDYSRIDSRGGSMGRADSNVALANALANLRLAIAESGTRLEMHDLPWVVADLPQVTQIFQNLIANSIKYRGPEAPLVKISASPADSNGSCEFVVEDNGLGIEPVYFERIFGIFQRLHTRKEYPGTGIGLALCKKIVERHGGRIWVDSTPGSGSKFHFTLREVPPHANNTAD
jgi:signal transduction histidine kinase